MNVCLLDNVTKHSDESSVNITAKCSAETVSGDGHGTVRLYGLDADTNYVISVESATAVGFNDSLSLQKLVVLGQKNRELRLNYLSAALDLRPCPLLVA